MDFELWWLLPIPALFFALGWIAARIDIKHLLRESRALPLSYFRGLNFLLNEQPDKAIESFIEVVKVDPQTIDLHFALGSLFRRQGEIDRAIRMHQNLLDRPDLPADKRQTARLRARAGLPSRRTARSRRGAVHASSTAPRSSTSRSASCCRSTSRKRTGRRRSPRPSAWRRSPSARTSRKSRTTTASWRRRAAALAIRRGAQRISSRRWRNTSSCTRATMLLGDLEAQQRRRSGGDRRVAADRIAEPGVSRRWSRTGSPTRIAGMGDVGQGMRVLRSYEEQYPSLDLLNALFNLMLAARGCRCGDAADQGRARAQSDAARARPAARGAVAGRAGRAPARPRAGQGPGRAAHQAPRHVQLRALRLPRQAVLLALSRLRQVGNVFAAANGNPRWLCLIRRVIVALDFADPAHALALADRLDPRSVRAQGRQGAVRRRRARAGALDDRARFPRLPRPQVPRHSEHGGAGLRRRDAARASGC